MQISQVSHRNIQLKPLTQGVLKDRSIDSLKRSETTVSIEVKKIPPLLQPPEKTTTGFDHAAKELEALTDADLLLMLISSLKGQVQNRNDATEILHDLNLNWMRAKENYLQEQKDKSNEMDEQSKNNKVFSWISSILWGATVASGAVSVILTIATAGAALPALLTVLNASLSISSGSASVGKLVLDSKASKLKGELKGISEIRQLLSEKIHLSLSEISDSKEKILQTYQEMAKVAKHYHSTCLGA